MGQGGRGEVHTKCFVLSYALKMTRGLVEYNETRRSVFFFFFFLSLLTSFRTCSRFKIHARARAPRFHPKEKRKERKNSWLKRSKWNLVGTLLSNDARLGFFFFVTSTGKKSLSFFCRPRYSTV